MKVRTEIDDDTYNDVADGPSQGASRVDIEDVFLDDNLVVEPADLTYIRDMTASMNRKKSIRQVNNDYYYKNVISRKLVHFCFHLFSLHKK